jgi:FkbM family methyltransferase
MDVVANSFRYSKRIVNILRGKDIFQRVQITCRTLSLGNKYACWSICPNLLSEKSVVYSIGVGEDISFDLELIKQFGVRVHAFDPTPRSILWVRGQNLPLQFSFYEWGIASHDGHSEFAPPLNPAHVSHTMARRTISNSTLNLPVRRLSTVMQSLGHSQIDLLKMDIEGAEYDVIEDILVSCLPVRQLLVEFHHRWPEVGIKRTKDALRKLNSEGYKIFNISPSGEEYSFRKV